MPHGEAAYEPDCILAARPGTEVAPVRAERNAAPVSIALREAGRWQNVCLIVSGPAALA
jgi:hypothetical protein